MLLSTGAEVFSFDSSSAVESNWRNNGNSSRLHLFQADIYSLPSRQAAFDKVLCLGVLQHTPDPEKAFSRLAQMVRPAGELVIDIYEKSIVALLRWKYVLRPLTRRMNRRTLYRVANSVVPILLPVSRVLRRLAGRIGARVVPIVDYSHLGLSEELNKQWAVLDTFDMYAPTFDRPQTMRTVEGWYGAVGFEEITVRRGPNGVVGKGRRPS